MAKYDPDEFFGRKSSTLSEIYLSKHYDPPIKAIYEDWKQQFDDGVYRAVVNVKIEVDKDELIRALKYDRDQYEKGFNDAMRAAGFAKDTNVPDKNVVKSNADRIRDMSDEELAEFMINGCDCIAPSDNCYTPHYDCKMCWLDWLRQEVSCGCSD